MNKHVRKNTFWYVLANAWLRSCNMEGKKKSLEPVYFEGCAKNPSKDVFPSVLF